MVDAPVVAGLGVLSVVASYLLHNAGLALGKGDVASRFIVDKLDLNLATLTTSLLVIVVVVVGGAGALTLDATVLADAAIADRVRLVEVAGRALVVLISDVGHGCQLLVRKVSRGKERQFGGDAPLSVVPMDLCLFWRQAERLCWYGCRFLLSQKPGWLLR